MKCVHVALLPLELQLKNIGLYDGPLLTHQPLIIAPRTKALLPNLNVNPSAAGGQFVPIVNN